MARSSPGSKLSKQSIDPHHIQGDPSRRKSKKKIRKSRTEPCLPFLLTSDMVALYVALKIFTAKEAGADQSFM